MQVLFITNWLDESIAKAIGWTLVHSLWQGALLTIIAGILIMATRRLAPAIRYRLLTGLFIVFLIVFGFTLAWQLNTIVVTNNRAEVTANEFFPDSFPVIMQSETDDVASPLQSFSDYFNSHASIIVSLWLVIFIFKCIQFAGSISYIRRLRRRGSHAAADLQDKATELALTIGLKHAVLLMESTLIKIPVVIGFLKPVILLPFGILTNLPVEQVEAVLLHELAHIRRKDSLINLLQCMAEKIFFFNPAILWLSSKIREERESCCDDIAITVTHDKIAFVRALIAFQEYHSDASNYTLAFPGSGYHLLNRVKRIIYNDNKNLNNMEKLFLALGLLVTGLITLAFSSTHAKPGENDRRIIVEYSRHSSVLEQGSAIQFRDTVPEKEKRKKKTRDTKTTTTTRIENGKEIRVVDEEIRKSADDRKPDIKIIEDKEIRKSRRDDGQMTDKKMKNYRSSTDKAIQGKAKNKEDIEKRLEKAKKMSEGLQEKSKALKQQQKELSEKYKEASREQLEKYKANQNELKQQQKELFQKYLQDQKGYSYQSKQQQKKLFQYQNEYKKRTDHFAERQKQLRQEYLNRLKEQRTDYNRQRNLFRYDRQKQFENTIKARQDETRKRAEEIRKKAAQTRENAKKQRETFINNITTDLIAENVIRDKKDLASIKLNKDELIVNGGETTGCST